MCLGRDPDTQLLIAPSFVSSSLNIPTLLYFNWEVTVQWKPNIPLKPFYLDSTLLVTWTSLWGVGVGSILLTYILESTLFLLHEVKILPLGGLCQTLLIHLINYPQSF